MNWTPIIYVGAAIVFALPLRVAGQTVLSDFSDFASQNPNFLDSWTDSGNDQFVQNAGYVSIVPLSGGNPLSDGRFLVPVSLDLGDFAALQITARETAGNLTDAITVIFENTGGATREYSFVAGDFEGGSFVTTSIQLSLPSYSDGNFEPSAVTAWGIEGNKAQIPVQDFRFDFGNLQLTPVPEPATWALLVLGAGACWLRRRR